MQKLKQAFNKLKDFLNKHEDLRQLVMFVLFSLVCFAIEYVTWLILELILAKEGEAFDWFIFHYTTGGVGEFIAFLVSNVIAQICTFILNRKKTFKATNNIIYAASMYAVMVVGIIILNTWLGGVISDAMSNGTNVPQDVCALVGKLVGSFLSFVISFLMSKFVIMRSPKKKDDGAEIENADSEADALVAEESEADALVADGNGIDALVAETAATADESESVVESDGEEE